jgi:hypothetical protein
MRVGVAECDDPHKPDQHFVAIHARNGRVQTRYFARKGFAASRVESIDVVAGEFACEIAKIITPRRGSDLSSGVP